MNINDYYAMFKEDRENARTAVRNWRKYAERLDEIQKSDWMNHRTPDDTIKAFYDEVGEKNASFVLASLLNVHQYDGRISEANLEFARIHPEAMDRETALNASVHTSMHMCHLDQIVRAYRKLLSGGASVPW